jgi:DNA topoisomerase-3
MSKALYIAEKPSVAREFAKALKLNTKNNDGYMEGADAIVTWCVGHLVTMSYPEVYDEKFKRWNLATLPFLPQEFLYEVIPGVKKQFQIVASLLSRQDVETIYVCTDSGREGEYIYRLVEQMAQVTGKVRKRVWIDSQTEDEIIRGVNEAKDLSEYDNLSASAYLRAKEDYLMGINFSRLLTLKYAQGISSFLKTNHTVVSVGRVMTCVLGMVVRREREIREFVKTPFFRVVSKLDLDGQEMEAEWRAVSGSHYFASPKLYKDNGFLKKEDAEHFIQSLRQEQPTCASVVMVEKKKEKKSAPLLYNLAELQNDCARMFKISPDETLRVVQELYEKKMVTYPRTDARVLSSAVAKEIHKNITGLKNIAAVSPLVEEILTADSYKNISKTKYVNDKLITDHYAIIPTGQGMGAIKGLQKTTLHVYEVIVRRFLSIFYPPAVYQKITLTTQIQAEKFFSSYRLLISDGYLKVLTYSFIKKQDGNNEKEMDPSFVGKLSAIKKGAILPVLDLLIKEGETTPPKRYNSGSLILAMENAGQLIEDEDLRAQIKSSGIGTSATRAEILKKLIGNNYLGLNKKTQIITPLLLGEIIFDVVNTSIRSLLNPELTASWEKGLNYVAMGTITPEEYMEKLETFIRSRTQGVLQLNNQYTLQNNFKLAASFYKTASHNTKLSKAVAPAKSAPRESKIEKRKTNEAM